MRDSFFSAIRMWPGLRDYVLQMRFKPMPTYRDGVVARINASDAVGKMIIQPDVEDGTGTRRKLDDVLGPWFAIVGWQVDPQSVLSPAEREFWVGLGARFVQVQRSRCAERPGSDAGGSATCVQDVDNGLADWFAEHKETIVVVRPDRYIAAQFNPTQAAEATRRFREFTPAATHRQKVAA